MKLSKHTLKQIENLKDLYDFDLENQVVTIPLHFESTEDLLDIHLSQKGKPVISKDALDYLIDIIMSIPSNFTVDFALKVDDCGEYTHKQLLEAIRNTIENKFCFYDSGRKKDNVLAVIFIIIGIVLLTFEIVGVHYNFFGEEGAVNVAVIESILDVLSWVFIWEGGAILFLTYENESTLFHKEIRRFRSIRMLDSTDKQVIGFSHSELYRDWVQVGKLEMLTRNFILFAYPVILAGTAIEMSEVLGYFHELSALEIFSYILGWIMIVPMVISNICFYLDRGWIKKLAFPLSLIMTLYMIYSIIGWLTYPEINIKFFVFDCIITLFFTLNTICLIYMIRQNVNVGKKVEQIHDKK